MVKQGLGVAAVAATLAMGGCSNNASTPGAMTTVTQTVAVTHTVTPTAAVTLAPLTPVGWGEVTLGMTPSELDAVAEAMTLVPDPTNSNPDVHGCHHWERAGMTVWGSKGRPEDLVFAVTAMGTRTPVKDLPRTPEGLGVGSTPAEVTKAYPDAEEGADMGGKLLKVNADGPGTYVFHLDADGVIDRVDVLLDDWAGLDEWCG